MHHHVSRAVAVVGSVWDHFRAPLIGGIIALPLAVLLVARLAQRRRTAGVEPGWALRSALAEVAIVVGTVPWVWLILTPNPGHARGRNLVPFRDLANQIHHGFAFAGVQIGGNLLVFAALGFFLPIRFRVGPLFVLTVGVIASSTVETLQWVLRLGRFSSVDDVIVNAAGALIAALLSHRWWRRNAVVEPHVAELDAISGKTKSSLPG
jgi:hypothetical protein